MLPNPSDSCAPVSTRWLTAKFQLSLIVFSWTAESPFERRRVGAAVAVRSAQRRLELAARDADLLVRRRRLLARQDDPQVLLHRDLYRFAQRHRAGVARIHSVRKLRALPELVGDAIAVLRVRCARRRCDHQQRARRVEHSLKKKHGLNRSGDHRRRRSASRAPFRRRLDGPDLSPDLCWGDAVRVRLRVASACEASWWPSPLRAPPSPPGELRPALRTRRGSATSRGRSP